MTAIIELQAVNKVYKGGFQALDDVNLSIRRGEIFDLLGPNGAGKTTLISAVCGLLNISSGKILVDGLDSRLSYREVRRKLGLVPQELTTDAFETVWNTVSFSRGLFGKKRNPAFIEELLKSLSLWDKKDSKLMMLSGGMKRRVLIAKALSHEPKILFLDEPTAGVDVELRKSMWQLVGDLRDAGVTIILTTHYIEEAEEMADRIGVINGGKLLLVEEKKAIMDKLGSKQLIFDLKSPVPEIPSALDKYSLNLSEDGYQLTYSYEQKKTGSEIPELIRDLQSEAIFFKDLYSRQKSLEDIFVNLVQNS
ncbi:MAG: ABC transporter ATP-binding protein [Pseudobacteriovorax sp.]|nr:ABC transporter ATP-binding protein [Pseudobacteriovorax sp.]